MSETEDALRDERNHWIGEAKRYERLYRMREEDADRWFRQRNEARAEVEELRAALERLEGAGTSTHTQDAPESAETGTEGSEQATPPRWVDLFGADPDYCEGKNVGEWLDEQRGEA